MLPLLLTGLCLAAPERPKLAVLDLVDQGVGPEAAKSLTDIVTATLTELGVLDVLSRGDLQQMVAFEEQKQLMGCDSDGTACLAELGGALGVAMLTTGTVGKVSDTYIVNLTLIDSRTVTVLPMPTRWSERSSWTMVAAASEACSILMRLCTSASFSLAAW